MMKIRPESRCRWIAGQGFELDAKAIYIVGTNYVSGYVCTNFWDDWRPEVIAGDLDRIAATGLNAIRIPIFWEYTEPAQGEFRQEFLDRSNIFMEMAAERGLLVMPWFLVGVATGVRDVAWRKGESVFSETMTAYAENHLKKMVRHLGKHPNILCWDICDEPEWYSLFSGHEKLPYNPERFHPWMDRMYKAIKETDSERAVTLGFGHFFYNDYGMDVHRAGKTLDMMAVTAYSPHKDEDLVHGFRSTYFLGWAIRINDYAGKGVFACEAPGWTDILASDKNIGLYYRGSLMGSLANGSKGVLPWVWNDFDEAIEQRWPLDKYVYEKRFGISRSDGSLKPAGKELQEFGKFVEKYPPSEWKQITPEVAVLVPTIKTSELNKEWEFLFHHFIFLRQAGLRVRYIWPEDLEQFDGDGKVLFLPQSSGQPLLTKGWFQLRDYVEKGGTLVSTSSCPSSLFNSMFGVTVEGRIVPEKEVVFRNCTAPISSCMGMALPGGPSFSLVSPDQAKVLAWSEEDLPLVTMNQYGKGKAVYLAYSPEDALKKIHPEKLAVHPIHQFFRGMAQMVGLQCPAVCPDPRIEIDVRRNSDGRLLIILNNHSRFPVTTSLLYPEKGKDQPVSLAGNEILVLEK